MSSFIIILFIVISVLIYTICGADTLTSMGVSSDSLWHCFIYQFSHASWLHMLLNMFAIGYMTSPIGKIWERRFNNSAYSAIKILFAGYVSSVFAGAACASAVPTVGSSGIAFFLLGVLLLLNPTLKQVQSYMWIAAAVAIQIYFGKSNTALHLMCFVLGALYTIVHEFIRQYKANVNRGIYQY